MTISYKKYIKCLPGERGKGAVTRSAKEGFCAVVLASESPGFISEQTHLKEGFSSISYIRIVIIDI